MTSPQYFNINSECDVAHAIENHLELVCQVSVREATSIAHVAAVLEVILARVLSCSDTTHVYRFHITLNNNGKWWLLFCWLTVHEDAPVAIAASSQVVLAQNAVATQVSDGHIVTVVTVVTLQENIMISQCHSIESIGSFWGA